MRRLLPILSILLVVGLATPAVAAPPVTETITARNVTNTFVDFGPTCEPGGPLYVITIVFNLAQHVTTFDDGRVHEAFTWTGTFEAVPLDAGGTAHSGLFTVRGGFNLNRQSANGTFIFTANGRFEDGTRIRLHELEHLNATPTGAEFFFGRCRD